MKGRNTFMEGNRNLKKKNIVALAVAICIILSSLFVLYMDCQKENFHIDETYSYILSNSQKVDEVLNGGVFWDRWISHEDWDEFTSVQDGEQFDYATVYFNNTVDAHPPLFYWCLHTVCSLFPNSFNMWFGLGLNFVFHVLSLVVLYFISRRVIKNQWLALLPILLWGLSPLASDTAMFIRMYSLLTLFTLLSVLMHLKIYQDGQNTKRLLILFLITFLGAMTHYYFIISAFCFSVTYCIYKLIKKEYRQMFAYGFVELFAIILLFIVYPAAITQITGSPTNNVGNEVAATFFSISGWPNTIWAYIQQILFGWGAGLLQIKKLALILLVISIIVLILTKIKSKKTNTADSKQSSRKELLRIGIYVLTAFMTIIIVAKISFNFVYIRYFYHMIPLFITVAVMLIEWIATKFNFSKTTILCILVAFSLANAGATMKYNVSEYLFISAQETYDYLYEEYGDIPVIMLCDKEIYVAVSNFQFLKNYTDTYIMPDDDIDKIDTILKDKPTKNGVFLLIWTDTDWGNGYDSLTVLNEVKNNCTLFDNYEKLQKVKMNFCDIYYLS